MTLSCLLTFNPSRVHRERGPTPTGREAGRKSDAPARGVDSQQATLSRRDHSRLPSGRREAQGRGGSPLIGSHRVDERGVCMRKRRLHGSSLSGVGRTSFIAPAESRRDHDATRGKGRWFWAVGLSGSRRRPRSSTSQAPFTTSAVRPTSLATPRTRAVIAGSLAWLLRRTAPKRAGT